jgi:hypothetical protein
MDDNMTWLPTWQHFLLGEFSGGQVYWATSNPWTRNPNSKELQLELLLVLVLLVLLLVLYFILIFC